MGMTNEEAIRELKVMYEHILPYMSIMGTEAYEMAIKALQQQLCEDCISREETLKAFAEKCGGECACCEYNGSGYDNAENCKLIKSMPSVTPHKRGKWLDKKTTIKGGHGLAYGRYGCSVCKKKQPSKTDFCPNCGADMRESEK